MFILDVSGLISDSLNCYLLLQINLYEWKHFQVSDAQQLVRTKIVSPYLDDVISEQSLNEDPQGLKGLLQRVNKIIPAKLDLLVINHQLFAISINKTFYEEV